jgi:DNA-directed RNA polymerase subunit RPC12/RpoP
MQTLTFPCPVCGRRMGVGLDLAGRPVRCPHCRQVVVAPAPTGPSDRPAPSVADDRPPPSEPDFLAPNFLPPRREGAESIFGEPGDEDESVFASARPPRPSLPGESGDAAGPDERTEVMSAEVPAAPPSRPAPSVSTEPDIRASAFVPPSPKPADAPDPWAKLDDAPPAPAVVPVAPPDPPAVRRLKWAVAGLAAYAAVATGVAVWGWVRAADAKAPPASPPRQTR